MQLRALIPASIAIVIGISALSYDLQSAAQQGPRGVTEEMRIVSSDVTPGMRLSRVSDIQVNAAGLIFLQDASEFVIRVLTPDGKLLHSFGRKGQGPGEWRGYFDLFGTIGDTLLVRDQNSWDVNFFSSGGQLVRTWSARDPNRRVMASLRGNMTMAEVQVRGARAANGRTTVDSVLYVVLDSAGNTVNRILRTSGGGVPTFSVMLPTSGAASAVGYVNSQPFIPRVLVPEDPNGARGFIVLPYGEWGGMPGQIKLVSATSKGIESERIISLPTRRFQPSDIEAYVKQKVDDIMAPAERRGVPRANVEKQFRDAILPGEYLNSAEEVLMGRDGSVWIRPYWSATDWSVVVTGNAPSFTVRAPAGAKIHEVAANRFWGVTMDADGLPIVARYAVSAR